MSTCTYLPCRLVRRGLASWKRPQVKDILAQNRYWHQRTSRISSLSLSVARQAGGLEAGRPRRGVHGDVDVSSLLPIKVRVCVQVCPSSPKFKGGPSKGLSRLPPLIPIPCLPSLHDAMCDDEGDDVGWLRDERRDDVRGAIEAVGRTTVAALPPCSCCQLPLPLGRGAAAEKGSQGRRARTKSSTMR